MPEETELVRYGYINTHQQVIERGESKKNLYMYLNDKKDLGIKQLSRGWCSCDDHNNLPLLSRVSDNHRTYKRVWYIVRIINYIKQIYNNKKHVHTHTKTHNYEHLWLYQKRTNVQNNSLLHIYHTTEIFLKTVMLLWDKVG
jgi:hypothetical protein